MEKTLNRIVYELIELYRANYKVTDSLDERLVASWIQKYRALLIRETTEGIRYIDPAIIQVLPDVELTLVSSFNTKNPLFSNGQKLLRSLRKIPEFIDSKEHLPIITRVYGSEIIGESFEVVSPTISNYVGSGKFNNNTIYVFLYDGYIYLTSKSGIHKNISQITIDGVFYNPIEAYEFVNGEGTYDWDMPYPISETLLANLTTLIIKTNYNFILYPPQDLLNNSKDDLVNNASK